MQEPRKTESMRVPANSRTGLTLAGLGGQATSGSRSLMSTSTTWQYWASGSAVTPVDSRPARSRQKASTSCEGGTKPMMPPISVIWLASVMRPARSSASMAGPLNSTDRPSAPLEPNSRSTASVRSRAVQGGRISPLTTTSIVGGTSNQVLPVLKAKAMS